MSEIRFDDLQVDGDLAVDGSIAAPKASLSNVGENVLVLNRADAAGVNGMIELRRAGVAKFYLGFDANDNLVIFDSGPTARVIITPTGLITGGFVRKAGAYAAGDTTPSVAGVSYMVIANAGAVVITDFDDGVDGQEVTLEFADANTTINRTHCFLAGGVNFVGSADDTITLVKRGASWREKCRSVNA